MDIGLEALGRYGRGGTMRARPGGFGILHNNPCVRVTPVPPCEAIGRAIGVMDSACVWEVGFG